VDAAETIPAADIFLSTSLNEGVPYSLLEVLSAGVPIVAVKSGAIAEIIENRRNGTLTSLDPTEIAHQLSGLFLNPMQKSTLAQSVMDSSSVSSRLKTMVPSHILLYREILGFDGINSLLR
jgi:glycosyltransferase involved in cell wall biosynthesis